MDIRADHEHRQIIVTLPDGVVHRVDYDVVAALEIAMLGMFAQRVVSMAKAMADLSDCSDPLLIESLIDDDEREVLTCPKS